MPPVYVLIGGLSSRFGRDKATHPVEGDPWAVHVGRRLAGDGRFTLVGESRGAHLPTDIPRIEDSPLSAGPLAGMLAAIEDRRKRLGEGPLVVASCDLVRPRQEWLTPLLKAHEDDDSLEIAAYQAQGRWQPFPSVLHTRWEIDLRNRLRGEDKSCQSAYSVASSAGIEWSGPGLSPPQANTIETLTELLSTDATS